MPDPTQYLILMRHGEAGDKIPDEDRMLTREGLRQVRHVATQMLAKNLIPDIVLCSGIKRTQQTLHTLSEILPIPHGHIIDCQKKLYAARAAQDVLDILAEHIPSGKTRALVIGHNPGMILTASYLGAHHINRNSSVISQAYPTSTASIIQVTGAAWPVITPSQCVITEVISGAELPRAQSGFNLTQS